MDWTGRWIWIQGNKNPWNFWLSARKAFSIDGSPESGSLRITADTRYVVWVNGIEVGRGPVRAFHHAYKYDTYNLLPYLKPGENLIAVLVVNTGIGTFQNLPARGGLLAEVAVNGRIIAATGPDWKVSEHPARLGAISQKTPRITCQQGWVEHYDAFREYQIARENLRNKLGSKEAADNVPIENLMWNKPGFDDSLWTNAIEIGKPGVEPWGKLSERDIPFLTKEPILPVNVLRARKVKRPAVIHFDLRENLLPGYIGAEHQEIRGFLALVVESSAEQKVKLISPCEGNYSPGLLKVNGKEVERTRRVGAPFDHGLEFDFTLAKGENLLLWNVSGRFHSWSACYVIKEGSGLLNFKPTVRDYTSITFGPFSDDTRKEFEKLWQAKSKADLQAFERFALPVDSIDNVHMAMAFSEPVEELETSQFSELCKGAKAGACIGVDSDYLTEILLELPHMTSGYWDIAVDGPAGAVVDILGFESIQEGALDLTAGLCNTLRYRTRPGYQHYRSYQRRGARYLLLTVFTPVEPLHLAHVKVIQSAYPCTHRGAFRSSDHLLNRVWEMGRLTTQLCSEDTYVDCPTYEQTFWVGDARNEGAVNHYTFGEYALSKRCLFLAGESLERSPVVESQVPSAWPDILPTWSLLWVLACEEFWQITGDRDYLEKIYPYVKKQNDYCLSILDDNGLLTLPGWNLLDWAPLDTPSDAACTHIQAWLAMALRASARMAAALGKSTEIESLEAAADNLKDAINKVFWSEERQAYLDSLHKDGTLSTVVSQGTNTIMALSDCATPERAEKIKPLIWEAPEGVIPVGSPFFMFFSFEALAKLGDFERILELTRKHWGKMLDTGSTTCWETFQGFEAGGRYTRSHCHAWSAAPTYFQSRYQLGVEALEPGFRKVRIAPEPAGLDWAMGRVPTPYGEISVDWKSRDGSFDLAVEIPAGIEAEIVLPVKSGTKVQAEGCSEKASSTGKPTFLMSGKSAKLTAG